MVVECHHVACVCVYGDWMKILKKKIFFKIVIFFQNWEKGHPNSILGKGRISAPENKNPFRVFNVFYCDKHFVKSNIYSENRKKKVFTSFTVVIAF